MGGEKGSVPKDVSAHFGDRTKIFEKDFFDLTKEKKIRDHLGRLKKKQVIVAGIETHVCVYQTVTDLLAAGYDVTIVADAMSSRTAENRDIAIRRMVTEGARLSSTEMVLFELTVNSGTDEFRAIARLVK